MIKRFALLSFVIFLLVCSVVFAGPFRDIEISVLDPYGNGVENALVVMHALHGDYYNYEGFTNASGELVFEDVDARVWIPKNSGVYMRDGGSGGGLESYSESESVDITMSNVPIKETIIINDIEVVSSRAIRYSHMFERRLFFDISPGLGCSYNFIAYTHNETLNFRYNPIELEFVVSDGAPVVNLPELSINELNDSPIVLDLEEYIIDDDFENLIITLEDVSWSEVDGDISIVDDELVVNFFPSIDLVYHQDNELSFTVVVDDRDNVVSQDLVWDYSADYRALKGTLVRMYDPVPLSDYDLFIDNDVDNVLIDGEEFMAFFDYSVNALINVTSTDYYLSAREIRLTEFDGDVDLEFTVAPVQIDPDLNDDRHELAFTTTFRLYGATLRYYEPPLVVICDYPYYENYNPSAAEVQLAVDAVNWLDEFTDDFYVPVQGESYLIVNTFADCDYYYSQEGVMSIYWDPTLPFAGGNTLTPNADYTIHNSRVWIKDSTVNLPTYLQEIFQAMGPTVDNGYFEPSIFCDSTCAKPDEPTIIDLEWGHRQHSRQPRNQFNDVDYYFFDGEGSVSGRNVYYEIREASDMFINGEKVITSRLLGYLKKGQDMKDSRDLIKFVPKGAKVIEAPKMRNEIRIYSKIKQVLEIEKINKIEKLFSKKLII